MNLTKVFSDNILIFSHYSHMTHRQCASLKISPKAQTHCVCVWSYSHTRKKNKKSQNHAVFLSFTPTDTLAIFSLHERIIRANNTVPHVITAIITGPGLHYRLRLWTWSGPQGEFAQVNRSVEGRPAQPSVGNEILMLSCFALSTASRLTEETRFQKNSGSRWTDVADLCEENTVWRPGWLLYWG